MHSGVTKNKGPNVRLISISIKGDTIYAGGIIAA